MSKGRFKVILTVVSEHEFIVDQANSEEEAISIAEALLEDGESGSVTSEDVAAWDAYPEEEEEKEDS